MSASDMSEVKAKNEHEVSFDAVVGGSTLFADAANLIEPAAAFVSSTIAARVTEQAITNAGINSALNAVGEAGGTVSSVFSNAGDIALSVSEVVIGLLALKHAYGAAKMLFTDKQKSSVQNAFAGVALMTAGAVLAFSFVPALAAMPIMAGLSGAGIKFGATMAAAFMIKGAKNPAFGTPPVPSLSSS